MTSASTSRTASFSLGTRGWAAGSPPPGPPGPAPRSALASLKHRDPPTGSALPPGSIQPMSKLNGKTALVTGGGSGIGLAVTRAFLEEGARVAITGRNEDRLRQAAQALGAGERLTYHAADVSDPEKVANLVRAVTGRWG